MFYNSTESSCWVPIEVSSLSIVHRRMANNNGKGYRPGRKKGPAHLNFLPTYQFPFLLSFFHTYNEATKFKSDSKFSKWQSILQTPSTSQPPELLRIPGRPKSTKSQPPQSNKRLLQWLPRLPVNGRLFWRLNFSLNWKQAGR